MIKILELKGICGKKVSVCDNAIKINDGMFAWGQAKEHSIPIRNIISVYIKKPGFQAGMLKFQTAGEMDSKNNNDVNAAIHDKNAITFNGKDKYNIAMQIKSYIENYNEKIEPKAENSNTIDELIKLKKLLDDNAISINEYNCLKSRIINK